MIVRHLKEIAEAHLGQKVKKAVMTVPDSFNAKQREATREVARMAGLRVRVISDAHATALAYGMEKKLSGNKKSNILILDLGGRKLSVSVLEHQDGEFKVKSTASEPFGGDNFDMRIIEEYYSYPERSKRSREVEKAKISLSTGDHYAFEVVEEYIDKDNDDLDCEKAEKIVTRGEFEELSSDLFESIVLTVEKALKNAYLDKNSIDDIILVGGSTRIPKIQQMIRDFFNGKELNMFIDPDEAVVSGAAVEAAILSGGYEALSGLKITDARDSSQHSPPLHTFTRKIQEQTKDLEASIALMDILTAQVSDQDEKLIQEKFEETTRMMNQVSKMIKEKKDELRAFCDPIILKIPRGRGLKRKNLEDPNTETRKYASAEFYLNDRFQ